MKRLRDPDAMSPEERLAELGSLLATAVRRLRLRQKELADQADRERPCDRPVDGPESPDPKEAT